MPRVLVPLTDGVEEMEAVIIIDCGIITSQGPGTAFEFALTLVRLAEGPAAADKVAGPMIL